MKTNTNKINERKFKIGCYLQIIIGGILFFSAFIIGILICFIKSGLINCPSNTTLALVISVFVMAFIGIYPLCNGLINLHDYQKKKLKEKNQLKYQELKEKYPEYENV